MCYKLTVEQKEWAKHKKQGIKPSKLEDLIIGQGGQCALSGVELSFNKRDGTPGKGKDKGCHPLYAAVDHISPSNDTYGYQLVCYDLNDLKGHLPNKIFKALKRTKAWKQLMDEWKIVAKTDPKNRNAFKFLLKDPELK